MDPARDLGRFLDLKHEAVRAGSATPVLFVGARFGNGGTPSLAQRAVPKIVHVAAEPAIVEPARIETVVNQRLPVRDQVVKFEQSWIERRIRGNERSNRRWGRGFRQEDGSRVSPRNLSRR